MKVYVAMHKIMDLKLSSPIYEPIFVGSKGKTSEGILRDDVGKYNISEKNKNYCELTALYWIWKNSKEDIVGLCHYRRFFYKNIFSMKPTNILDENIIQKDLKKYDIILPKKEYIIKSNIELNEIAPNAEDLGILKTIIKDKFPDYYDSFVLFENSKSRYLCNMYISDKVLSDKYCEWLFSVLDECEKVMVIDDNDTYRRRMFGFLSERLLNVWVLKNNLKVKEYICFNSDKTYIKNLFYYIKNFIKHIIVRFFK